MNTATAAQILPGQTIITRSGTHTVAANVASPVQDNEGQGYRYLVIDADPETGWGLHYKADETVTLAN